MDVPRQIFIVDAIIVDANGTFNHLANYPKPFDSKLYGNDIDKTLKRAMGDASETFGAMCKNDTRQLQTVTIMTADGQLVEKRVLGKIADVPEQTA